jgi:hypothetical protein
MATAHSDLISALEDASVHANELAARVAELEHDNRGLQEKLVISMQANEEWRSMVNSMREILDGQG